MISSEQNPTAPPASAPSDDRPDYGFAFDNSYARDLEDCFVRQAPAQVPEPRMVRFNRGLARALGLDAERLDGPEGALIFSGNRLPAGADPLAQAYAGHQFGGFSPQLGDGRALLLGEVIDVDGNRRDIALKGSGRTPFSRGGDGKAALGPVLREYLIGEAMHALGIPTTRALAAVRTGEPVYRETVLPGAVLTRVAASHLRVGTFQFFAVRGQHGHVRRLLDHTIARHYPELADAGGPAIGLLEAVAKRQARLIARWMQVGFIHGVMNTDNMTLSGETIDYGPCAFLEAYDPAACFSSIDTGGRYAFGNQPHLARWNLARLAETLLPLIDDDNDRAIERATVVIDAFPGWFEQEWLAVLRAKLGLNRAEADDMRLAADWLELLHRGDVDYTLAWRRLIDEVVTTDGPPPGATGAGAQGSAGSPLAALFDAGQGLERDALSAWLARWRERRMLESNPPAEQAAIMRAANPVYIPRNHRVEEALAAAHDDDLEPFDRLLEVLARPFDERPGLEDYTQPAPAAVTARYQTFCGT